MVGTVVGRTLVVKRVVVGATVGCEFFVTEEVVGWADEEDKAEERTGEETGEDIATPDEEGENDVGAGPVDSAGSDVVPIAGLDWAISVGATVTLDGESVAAGRDVTLSSRSSTSVINETDGRYVTYDEPQA